MSDLAPDHHMQNNHAEAPVLANGDVDHVNDQREEAQAADAHNQAADDNLASQINGKEESKEPMQSAPQSQVTPAVATNGATTRQRSGKATPAKPQPPKLAPKPISKAKKSKKKGKAPEPKKTLMTLYGYWRSSCTWRVRLALRLKGFNLGKDIEYIPVHLVKDGGEQKSESYTKLNPSQYVPTLILKDKNITKKPITLAESMAICEYLEEAYPSKRKLLPKDPFKRYQVRRLCEMINSGIQPVQNLSVLQEVGSRFGDEHKTSWAQWAITRGLTSFEQVLEQTKGKYCLGNIISLADVFLPAQVYNAERFKVDMSQFPAIMSVMDNLKTIPEFVASHPSQQPDAEQP